MKRAPNDLRPGRRRRGTAVVAVLFFAIGGWVVWAATSGAAEDADAGATATGSAVIQQIPVEDRREVDRFTAVLLDGSPFDSSSAGGGGVVVYNVWGSWCGPCRVEAPALRRAATELAGRVRFVGINVRDNLGSAQAFERSQRMPYTSIRSDDGAQALLAFGSTVGVTAVPTTLVVDHEERLAARVVGPVTYATLRALVDDVLAESDSDGVPQSAG